MENSRATSWPCERRLLYGWHSQFCHIELRYLRGKMKRMDFGNLWASKLWKAGVVVRKIVVSDNSDDDATLMIDSSCVILKVGLMEKKDGSRVPWRQGTLNPFFAPMSFTYASQFLQLVLLRIAAEWLLLSLVGDLPAIAMALSQRRTCVEQPRFFVEGDERSRTKEVHASIPCHPRVTKLEFQSLCLWPWRGDQKDTKRTFIYFTLVPHLFESRSPITLGAWRQTNSRTFNDPCIRQSLVEQH